MKTIVAGSRLFNDMGILHHVLHDIVPWDITVVISGRAQGADMLGEQWAEFNNVPLIRFPADWDKFGKAAGPIRNKEMADHGDALVAFLDVKGSTGTANMIETWKKWTKVHIALQLLGAM
jgi:hypothetical protein